MGESIYGNYKDNLPAIMDDLVHRIEAYNQEVFARTGAKLYEHLTYRVKTEDSMREKCRTKGLPETPQSALRELTDAVGLRIVCLFIDDVYENIRRIKGFAGCTVVTEKDYIRSAKPNGYRSYHLILSVDTPFEDVAGNTPGQYFVEIQLRTIAMDTWAALEHEMKYKHSIADPELIEQELKRCADELAACDVSMQTIRDLIRNS